MHNANKILSIPLENVKLAVCRVVLRQEQKDNLCYTKPQRQAIPHPWVGRTLEIPPWLATFKESLSC